MTAFGAQGETVYRRTYSRPKPDGSRETWPETVVRVVDGNLALGDSRHELPGERQDLIDLMSDFRIIPAGRHLWASGTRHTNLYNCWVSDYTDNPSDHFTFTFLRLMEGGGVGANYSNTRLQHLPEIRTAVDVHIVCDPAHADYAAMQAAGLLSDEYSDEWGGGAFEVEDSREGWAGALADLFDAAYRPAEHTSRVFDVSRVRPAGSRLKTFGGTASGPQPLAEMLREVGRILAANVCQRLSGLATMSIDHEIAKCVVSGGARRSARMSIMHWQDPDILRFINAKSGTGQHWTTNISVEVDSAFWARVKAGYSQATQVLQAITDGMVRNGEPGIWNSELSNQGEPNTVVATNPCGEIPLEPWEPCNLGHVNLGAFDPEDVEDMVLAHRLMTRFVIRATNAVAPDPKSAAVIARNRRVGVGHLGVATFLAKAGVRYSDASDGDFPRMLLELYHVVLREAIEYAHALRIPVPVKLTTVAPTGTIAKLPGVTEGIHPVFGKYFTRRVRFSKVDADQVAQVDEFRRQGYAVEDDLYADQTAVVSFPTKDSLLAEVEDLYRADIADQLVQPSNELTLTEQLGFQRMYQQSWADNAVSYTVNLPDGTTAEELAQALRAVGSDLKGTTVFPETSMAQAPYERITKAEYELADYLQTTADGVDEDCASGACPVR